MAALEFNPDCVDCQAESRSRARRKMKEPPTEHDRGFAAGVAVACGIVFGSFGAETEVEEVLTATGFDTRAKFKALGADDYDLKILKPVFATLRNRKA
jgi:hypothetical protein